MAAVRSDRIGVPTGLNERRKLAWLRSCADEALAGRVVWSVASLPDGHATGRHLQELLDDSIEVAEPGLGERVRPGDVVVLHDRFTISSATALRERGAHPIWHLHRRSATRAPSVREAIDFLDRGGGGAVDAVVIDGAELITAFLPAARLLDIREVSRGGDAARVDRVELAWRSLLGDIVEEDRADRVGGTIQVRPVVAAR